ncbi:MAG: hypothetical protein OEU32_17760, partial [Acidimicrobiia bacterium]|nr:hypothetical protein [Acidimicrobiia bacterium]
VGADTAEPDEPVGAIADAPAGLSAPCRVVAARLPWHAADEVDRRVLATLVLAVGEPWAVRDHARVAGVAAAFERLPIPSRRDGASPSTAGIEHEEPSGHIGPRGRVHDTDVSSPTDAPARADLPVDAEQSTTRAEDLDRSSVAEDQGEDLGVHEVPQLPVSGFGGLFFLIHVFEALDIVASIGDDGQSFRSAPIPEVIAHLAARIGGAPLDDPAVLALSGVPDDDVDRLQIDLAPAVDTALDEIVAAMRTWLAMRLDDDPANLEWVWARPARLHVEPGWIEVRLDLADVDVRLRVAGLDLDPGFVWWRGAIVRFRYV